MSQWEASRDKFIPHIYLDNIVQRVKRHNGFYEWFYLQIKPRGSGTFRGSAGVPGKAIEMLQSWARTQVMAPAQ